MTTRATSPVVRLRNRDTGVTVTCDEITAAALGAEWQPATEPAEPAEPAKPATKRAK